MKSIRTVVPMVVIALLAAATPARASASAAVSSVPSTTAVVPEPATMTMMATGLVGMFGAGLRRRNRNRKP